MLGLVWYLLIETGMKHRIVCCDCLKTEIVQTGASKNGPYAKDIYITILHSGSWVAQVYSSL